MKAVVIAPGINDDMDLLVERYPVPMLPLVDRPFIQHIVEYLVEQGVSEFDFILSHFPEKIEAFLGDGTRWGSSFKFHLAKDPTRPYKALKTLDFDSSEEIICFAHADYLPEINFKKLIEKKRVPTLFCVKNKSANNNPAWTGWALLTSRQVKSISEEDTQENIFSRLFPLVSGNDGIIGVSRQVNVRSYQGLIESHTKVLANKFSGLMSTFGNKKDSLWLSRNVTLHQTAKLVSPVYIGENCRVGAGVKLGPNAFIGSNTVLDSGSVIKDSIIFPGSYVGESLELSNVIVDKNRLLNFRIGAETPVTDNFILGSLSDKSLRLRGQKAFSKIIAVLLFIFFLPVFLSTMLILKLARKGQVFYRKEAVSLPAQPNKSGWKTFRLLSFSPVVERKGILHFIFNFIPALINVSSGDIGFFGVTPRPENEIESLPDHWKALYLQTNTGIITESYVNYGNNPSKDELFSAEAVYFACRNIRHDLALLIKYFARILK